jgi:hypothetical protein
MITPTTPALREERKRKLQSLSQVDYQNLRNLVHYIVPRKFCDPDDALSHGLLIAMQKYDGRGELKPFVMRCAYLYSLQQVKKTRLNITFTDLQNESDFAEYLDEVLPYLEDSRYVEAVDELFVRRIDEILDSMKNFRFRFASKEAIADAHTILALFRENANLGKGIGVDEYEDGPLNALKRGKRRSEKPTHNTRIVRKNIVDHLADELHTTEKDISSACKALRLSTRQALNEGWLPT